MALLRRTLTNLLTKRNFIMTSTVKRNDNIAVNLNDVNVSRIMRIYKKKAEDQKIFMNDKLMEYDIGKRHLANIMGEDVETFNQDDINRAIAYLLPSGLFEPSARPNMQHPDVIYPKLKDVQFDNDGRPLHSLFYTVIPNYYQLLRNVSTKANELNQKQMKQSQSNSGFRNAEEAKTLDFETSRWINKQTFIDRIGEELSDVNFEFFITSIDRLASHPLAYLEEKFIMTFRVQNRNLFDPTNMIPEFMYTEMGIPYVTESIKVRKCHCTATIYGKGTGKITINDDDITFFDNHQEREQIIFPLQFTGMLQHVDIVATSVFPPEAWAIPESQKKMGPAYGIRHCISLALRSFVDQNMITKMKMAGLLTHDKRKKERKKPGRMRARRRYTWKKR